mgnify:CR=1 FL=1
MQLTNYTMNKYHLYTFPIFIIGITLILLGVRWMLVDEPWMLDQVANEERLDMTFNELFDSKNNETLPDYLRQIYRFFGLWVIIIGLFISLFSMPSIATDRRIRLRLLICVGLMILSGTILAYCLIPSSPFIYLGWFLLLMYSVATLNYKKFG